MEADEIEEEGAEEAEEEEEDEEEGSSDSDIDRREFGIYPCLPVEPGEPDWESGEPQTVEEYLRRVRCGCRAAGRLADGAAGRVAWTGGHTSTALFFATPSVHLFIFIRFIRFQHSPGATHCCRYEARQLPAVVTAAAAPQLQQPADQQTAPAAPHSQQPNEASAQEQGQGQSGQRQRRQHQSSRYLSSDEGVPSCDPALKPSAAWTRDFLRQFAQLRRRLQRCVGVWGWVLFWGVMWARCRLSWGWMECEVQQASRAVWCAAAMRLVARDPTLAESNWVQVQQAGAAYSAGSCGMRHRGLV